MNPKQMYPGLAGMRNTSIPQESPAPVEVPQSVPPQEMVGPEAVNELKQLVAEIEKKINNINMANLSFSDKDLAMKQNFLRQLFDELIALGVDLEDQSSVAVFLSELKEADPELAAAFEDAMAHLLEEPKEPMVQSETPLSLETQQPQPAVAPPIPESPELQSPPETPYTSL